VGGKYSTCLAEGVSRHTLCNKLPAVGAAATESTRHPVCDWEVTQISLRKRLENARVSGNSVKMDVYLVAGSKGSGSTSWSFDFLGNKRRCMAADSGDSGAGSCMLQTAQRMGS
jgi:hypothetical protein